ncbi:MAG: hypothetical protein V7K48_12760 [Nostoc sp.]|uniref:hypothetical protein n=1 Tax=Nostoc sp. TaxID=1180 RepID=UPI002FFAB307
MSWTVSAKVKLPLFWAKVLRLVIYYLKYDSVGLWAHSTRKLEAIAKGVFYAVSQLDDVDVNEVIVRPTASAV